MMFISYFFFSSRRRPTRLTCDWSSDVCSSDLMRGLGGPQDALRGEKLLEDACNKRDARACSNLASLAYRAGDAERAEQLAEQADDLGDPVGYAHLGDLYARTNDTV